MSYSGKDQAHFEGRQLKRVAGLIASFHGIMYAYGRQISSLSRAGSFPTFLSLTHRTHKTPWVALVAGGIAFVTLVTLFVVDPVDYRSAALGAAAWFTAGILSFALCTRRRLARCPVPAYLS